MPAKSKKTTKKDLLPKKEEGVEEAVVEEQKLDSEKEEESDNDSQIDKRVEPQIPQVSSFAQLDSNKASSEETQESEEKISLKDEEVAPPKKYTVEQLDVSPNLNENNKDDSDLSNEGVSEKGSVSSSDIKEWLKEVRPDTTKEVEKDSGSGLKLFIWIFILLILGGLIGGGVYYYKTKLGKEVVKEVPVENKTAETTPSPTLEIKPVVLSDYSVSVLNGSGIPGEAGKVSKLIEDLNFKKVDTGNAKQYNYTTTVVSLKENTPTEVYDKLKENISQTYIIEKDEKFFSDDSNYDVVITVGTKKSK